jgi:hypothetical protein
MILELLYEEGRIVRTFVNGTQITVTTTTCWYNPYPRWEAPELKLPKWWRWFDVFRVRVNIIPALFRTERPPPPKRPPSKRPYAVERWRWKRRRFVQGLYA